MSNKRHWWVDADMTSRQHALQSWNGLYRQAQCAHPSSGGARRTDAMVESAAVPSEGPCGAARAGWLAARLIFSRKDSRRCPGCRPPDACLAATPFGCCSWFLSVFSGKIRTTRLSDAYGISEAGLPLDQAAMTAGQGPKQYLLGPAPGDPSREGLCRASCPGLAAPAARCKNTKL